MDIFAKMAQKKNSTSDDIFSKIASNFKSDDVFSKIASNFKKEALTQPLQMRNDYGKQSADFLADSTVQKNTGYYQGLFDVGVDNHLDIIDDLSFDYSDQPLIQMAIIDDLDEYYDDGSRYARFSKGEKGKKEFEDWFEDQTEDFKQDWDDNKVQDEEEMKERFNKSSYIIDDIGLEHSKSQGSYMSRQNLNEMEDALQVVSDMVHEGDELEDWVEDKVSHAHATITDLARYYGYGRGYHEHHKHATNEDIIDDQDLNHGFVDKFNDLTDEDLNDDLTFDILDDDLDILDDLTFDILDDDLDILDDDILDDDILDDDLLDDDLLFEDLTFDILDDDLTDEDLDFDDLDYI